MFLYWELILIQTLLNLVDVLPLLVVPDLALKVMDINGM